MSFTPTKLLFVGNTTPKRQRVPAMSSPPAPASAPALRPFSLSPSPALTTDPTDPTDPTNLTDPTDPDAIPALHRQLFQHVIVMYHEMVKTTWAESLQYMYPPSVEKWDKKLFRSTFNEFQNHRLAGKKDKVIVMAAMRLLENTDDLGARVLQGFLGLLEGSGTEVLARA